MQAYEAGKPAYFATPPVNLIRAYQVSLTQITKSPTISLQDRFELHRKAALRVRHAATELGLKLVPVDAHHTANGMTAVSLPFTGLTATDEADRRSRSTFPRGSAWRMLYRAWRREVSSSPVEFTRLTRVSTAAMLFTCEAER